MNRRMIMAGAAVTGAAGVFGGTALWADQAGGQAHAAAPQQAQQEAAQGEAPMSPEGLGGQLVRGLLATPGCLGVDGGRLDSGKNFIMAWFENKAAAIRWYNSDVHRGAMSAFAGMEPERHRPLEHVKDEQTPIMVIASITYAQAQEAEGLSLPISQIAIELYAPLPGGAYVKDRVAPEAFEVPHMKDWAAEQRAEKAGY